jgi:hypothetical protein
MGGGKVKRGDEGEEIRLMGFISICMHIYIRNRMMKLLVTSLNGMGRGWKGGSRDGGG